MIKSAIEKILALAEPSRILIDGREYVNQQMNAIKPPVQSDLEISTLTSIEDYYRDNPDGINLDKAVVHVKDYAHVAVISAVAGDWIQRHGYLSASIAPKQFPYGQYIPIEEFMVSVQSYFVQDEITARLLQVVGNITDDTTIKYQDDGITQQVQAKTGLARIENVVLPNPVILAPYRTFNEVAQPASAFVFRLKKEQKARVQHCSRRTAATGNWRLSSECVTGCERTCLKEQRYWHKPKRVGVG